MPRPIVDEKKCKGSAVCKEVCPMNVFEIIDGKAKVVKPKECIGCRACEVQCPNQAIKVVDD
ncbi:hypothetical protein DRJ17_03950 [Candidatus Woesearchaeota archaeon]|nr:MAG: hypothetical protein DRJ17_03950 [Candidatus Woesearchaeota archaeon]